MSEDKARRQANRAGNMAARKQAQANEAANRAFDAVEVPVNELMNHVDELMGLLGRIADAWDVETWQVVEWLRALADLAETGQIGSPFSTEIPTRKPQ
jgi:hypothetical protein